MAKELTIKINIEGQDVVLTSKQLEVFKKNADELRKSLNELGQRTEQNAEQFDKLKGDLEALDKIFSQTKEEVQDTGDQFGETGNKAKSLRTQIRELTNQLQVLGPRTAENAAQFDALTNQLIQLQEVQEDVGFETQKLDDALTQIPGPIGQAATTFKVLDDGLKSARAAMISLTRTFPILKSAIAATGIGALVILIGALVAAVVKAFNSFKPLQDSVARLGILFDVLERAIQPLIDLIGQGLVVVLDGLAQALAFVTGQTEEFNKQLENKRVLDAYAEGIKQLEENLKLYGDLNTEVQNQQIELARAYQEELIALGEREVKDEEERARLKKAITERYFRDVARINKESRDKEVKDEKDKLDKIIEQRIQLEKQYNDQLRQLRQDALLLQTKTEVEASFLRLRFQKEAEERSIRESQQSQERKNQLLLELEKKYQLERELITRDAEKNITDFRRSLQFLGLETTADIAFQETRIRELEYQLQVEDLKKSFDDQIALYELFGEDTTELTMMRDDLLKLLEERKNRDLLMMNENFILEKMRQDKEYTETLLTQSEISRNVILTNANDIANAYQQSVKFGDIFFGGFRKRMSKEMEMEFQKIGNLKDVYEQQYKIREDNLSREQTLLDQAFANNIISYEFYAQRVAEIDQQSLQNRGEFINKMVEFDQIRLDAFRERKNVEIQIAENVNQILQNLLGDSVEAQKASAIAEATLAIARIIIDTQRAIVAYTAAVAPLGPVGATLAAKYAIVAKINAGLGIAAITTGAISKIKSINKSDVQSGGGERQSNQLGRGYAEGGFVTGPGTSKSDSIPANLSNGEFVMNAASTSMFLPMLEMLNNAGRSTSVPSLMTTLPDAPESNTKSEMIVKTYVVESDITSTQHKQARLKNLSTL